jgi:hypothetical protein
MADITAAAPVDDHATIDPIETILARNQMDEASARRVVRQAAAADGPTNIEVARLICRLLDVTAQQLGIPYDDVDFAGLCERIIAAAQGGKLDPGLYRAIWQIRALLSPRAETAAS